MAATDIRTMVPRVRRSVEGVGVDSVLTDTQVKDIVADALAAVILYTGSAFGKTLNVITYDQGIPTEYETSDALTLAEQTVVATQGALDYFFTAFGTIKTSEKIADEAQSWDYTLSASLIRDRFKMLQAERDKALEALLAAGVPLDAYASFLQARDSVIATAIEPWTADSGVSGLEVDYRFG